MLFLGIESSCDETAVAVAEYTDGRLRLRSNCVASQIDTHRLFGGVVPEIASRAHIEAITELTQRALSEAGCTLDSLTAIGVTSHPGLIGALLVGVNFAKSLAVSNGIPLVSVDHIKAHIATLYYENEQSPLPPLEPPYIALVASGGHTSVYLGNSHTALSYLGGTRDDAIGESFDKVGRLIGLPYPAGAGFDSLATRGFLAAAGYDPDEGDERRIAAAYAAYNRRHAEEMGLKLPSPALKNEELAFSFSGIKTAGVNLMHNYEMRGQTLPREAFAALYTYEVVEAVAGQMETVLRKHRRHPLAIAGGVAANTHLRRRLAQIAEEAGVALYAPPRSLCGDNGAMTAAATCFAYLNGERAGASLNASAADELT